MPKLLMNSNWWNNPSNLNKCFLQIIYFLHNSFILCSCKCVNNITLTIEPVSCYKMFKAASLRWRGEKSKRQVMSVCLSFCHSHWKLCICYKQHSQTFLHYYTHLLDLVKHHYYCYSYSRLYSEDAQKSSPVLFYF